MKVVSVVGARPQFIKAAVVSPALRKAGVEELLVHTGQHYDYEMSQVFFEGLAIPRPDVDLGVGSGTHGTQTGRMMEKVEEVLLREKPDLVIVHGDTNSTLAAALAAAKLHLPVAHVEAGLRSFDRAMPEEINRVLTDHISELLFAPTETAIENLRMEGISRGVVLSGDVMVELLDSVLPDVEAATPSTLAAYDLEWKQFVLATVHRAENTEDRLRWNHILDALQRVAANVGPVLWPIHPRTRARLASVSLTGVSLVKPLPYLSTQVLARAARLVVTDSGGLQKEAAFHGTPCLILRDRTEWVELAREGKVLLTGVEPETVVAGAATALSRAGSFREDRPRVVPPPAQIIVDEVTGYLSRAVTSKEG
ncbi:MAG: UDP-N-acetylglucosamine 2-epimerase (non-hydrolyzing) [Acidobacteriota bacterium]|jgi:UDP-N-acetylglucosamine 2-epimerase